MHKLAGVCIDKGLDPCTGLVVLDLHDVAKGEGAILLGDELQRGREVVILAVESQLGLADGFIRGESGGRRGNVG